MVPASPARSSLPVELVFSPLPYAATQWQGFYILGRLLINVSFFTPQATVVTAEMNFGNSSAW